jgi:acyl-homoserine-lactone acylase
VAQVYLRENFCVLADEVLTLSGARASYLGTTGRNAKATLSFVPVRNRDSDFFHKSSFDDTALEGTYQQVSADAREPVRGHIAGHNEFVQAAPPLARRRAAAAMGSLGCDPSISVASCA